MLPSLQASHNTSASGLDSSNADNNLALSGSVTAAGDVIHVPQSPRVTKKASKAATLKEQMQASQQQAQIQAAIDSIIPPPKSPSPQSSPISKITTISTSKAIIQQTPAQPLNIVQQPQQQFQYHLQQQQQDPTTSFVVSNTSVSGVYANNNRRKSSGTGLVTNPTVGGSNIQQQKNPIIFQTTSGSNRIILPNTFATASALSPSTPVPVVTNVPVSTSTGNRQIRPNVPIPGPRLSSPLILANQKTLTGSIRGGKTTPVNVYGGRVANIVNNAAATNIQGVKNMLSGTTKIVTSTGSRVGGITMNSGTSTRGGVTVSRGGGVMTRGGGVTTRGGGGMARGGGVITQRGGAMTRGGVMGTRGIGSRGGTVGGNSGVRNIITNSANKRQLITVGGSGGTIGLRGTNLVLTTVPMSSSTVDASTSTTPDTVVLAPQQHHQRQNQIIVQLQQQQQQQQLVKVVPDQTNQQQLIGQQVILQQQPFETLPVGVSNAPSVGGVAATTTPALTSAGIDDLHEYSFVEFPVSSNNATATTMTGITRNSISSTSLGAKVALDSSSITGKVPVSVPGIDNPLLSCNTLRTTAVKDLGSFILVSMPSSTSSITRNDVITVSTSSIAADTHLLGTPLPKVGSVASSNNSAMTQRINTTASGAKFVVSMRQTAASNVSQPNLAVSRKVQQSEVLSPNSEDKMKSTSDVSLGKVNILVDHSSKGSHVSQSNIEKITSDKTNLHMLKKSDGSIPTDVEIVKEVINVGSSEAKMILTTKGSHIKMVTPKASVAVSPSTSTHPQIIVSSKSGKSSFIKPGRMSLASSVKTVSVKTITGTQQQQKLSSIPLSKIQSLSINSVSQIISISGSGKSAASFSSKQKDGKSASIVPKASTSTEAVDDNQSSSSPSIMTVGASEAFASMKPIVPMVSYSKSSHRHPVSVVSVSKASAAVSHDIANEFSQQALTGKLSSAGNDSEDSSSNVSKPVSAIHVISTSQAFAYNSKNEVASNTKEITVGNAGQSSGTSVHISRTPITTTTRHGNLSEPTNTISSCLKTTTSSARGRKLSGNISEADGSKQQASNEKIIRAGNNMPAKITDKSEVTINDANLTAGISSVIIGGMAGVSKVSDGVQDTFKCQPTRISLKDVLDISNVKSDTTGQKCLSPVHEFPATLEEGEDRNSKVSCSRKHSSIESNVIKLSIKKNILKEISTVKTSVISGETMIPTDDPPSLEQVGMEVNEESATVSPIIHRSCFKKVSSQNTINSADLTLSSPVTKLSHSIVSTCSKTSRESTERQVVRDESFVDLKTEANAAPYETRRSTRSLDPKLFTEQLLASNTEPSDTEFQINETRKTTLGAKASQNKTSDDAKTPTRPLSSDSLRFSRSKKDSQQLTPDEDAEIEIKVVVDDDDDTLFLSSTKTRQRMSMARSSDLRPRDTKLCVGSKTVVTTDAKCLTDISPSLVVAAKTRGTAATSGSQHKEKLTVPEVQQKSSSAATTSNKAQSQKQKTRASSRLSLTPYEQAAMLRSGKKRTSM